MFRLYAASVIYLLLGTLFLIKVPGPLGIGVAVFCLIAAAAILLEVKR